MDKFEEKLNILRTLFNDALDYAELSHSSLFEADFLTNEKLAFSKLIAATTYLAEANSLFTQAKVFLSDNIDELGEPEEFLDTIFRFNVYNNEVLDNIRTNHSHQYSDIEFRNFLNSFRYSGQLLRIDDIDNKIDTLLQD
ncbi:hypothetical protein CIRMBP1315_02078 [Enterococcus cecorum]|uniref:hypothetical protein n=1 Tax=Enterococcus cecorum TaxID=44008 RepID=UPI0006430598|nr:hypothetical protein [Enterococcus cecorum]KLO66663.1 hypothetical protein AA986_05290 [Enterococcus cecorum]CAI3504957.1 hypothetical protein CIRMBP1315_02078 [Enterococcus cecorum]